MKQQEPQIISERHAVVLEKATQQAPKASTKKKSTLLEQETAFVREFVKQNKKGGLRVFVAGGSRAGNDAVYQEQAFALGEEIGKKQYRLDFGLASTGIMGAVAKGVVKSWLRAKKTNKKPIKAITTKEYLALYKSDALIDQFSDIVVSHTLEERKKSLLSADFVIFAPGGVGTLDELVYDCVAMQDGFLNFKPFVIFNVEGFFYHLLEFLKEIRLKDFASAIPFIVVDDSFEAGIAFDLLESFYTPKIQQDKTNAESILEELIYILPYVIHRQHLHPSKTVTDIVNHIHEIRKNGLKSEKEALEADIETAYLNKEIERMYDRLSRAGRDTAQVSDKLNDLKKRYRKNYQIHY